MKELFEIEQSFQLQHSSHINSSKTLTNALTKIEKLIYTMQYRQKQ